MENILPLDYFLDHWDECFSSTGGQNENGDYPLHFICRNAHISLQAMEHVVTHYDNALNQENRHGETPRFVDWAIRNGKPEILSMLLEHDASLGLGATRTTTADPTSLNELLNNRDKSYETKVAISQHLVAHADENWDTYVFLQSTLECAIEEACNPPRNDADNDNDDDDHHGPFKVLLPLEAGVIPRSQALHIAIREENVSLCQLLVHHGANPFRQDDTLVENQDNRDAPASLFLAAARLQDISIFAHFLDSWYNEGFSTSQGKNANGDYPLHIICRDPYVSLPAVVHVATHADSTVLTLSGQEGLFPFEIASLANTALDIVFYLLSCFPDALFHSAPMTGNKKEKKEEQEGSHIGGETSLN